MPKPVYTIGLFGGLVVMFALLIVLSNQMTPPTRLTLTPVRVRTLTPTPTPAPLPGTRPLPLTETYRSDDGALVVTYPAGWVVNDDAAQAHQVILGSAPVFNQKPAAGEVRVGVRGLADLTPQLKTLPLEEAALNLATSFFRDNTDNVQLGTPVFILIREQNAVYLTTAGEGIEGGFFLVDAPAGMFMVTFTTAPGAREQMAGTAAAIAASVIYRP